MNRPVRKSSFKPSPPGAKTVLAGWHGRLLGGLLIGVAIVLAAGGAHAWPLITGCCDSLTNPPNGYLPLIEDVYGAAQVDDFAWDGRTSYYSMYGGDGDPPEIGLGEYLELDGVDPEVVVVLSGTVDAFWGLNPNDTVDNVEQMVIATIDDGGLPILVAPPPVLPTCDPGPQGDPEPCEPFDDFIDGIRTSYGTFDTGLAGVASYHEVPFIDLYTLFGGNDPEGPDEALYTDDGIHPDADGDLAIAQVVIDELEARPACADGEDNDGDGAIDFGVDFGCDSLDDFYERTLPGVIVCDDGVDNDGDGLIDFHPDPLQGDPGCGHPLQMTESPACNDGIDNELDGLIDFDGGVSLDLNDDGFVDPEFNPAEPAVTAPDPHCGDGTITRETAGSAASCGLGFEVSLLLAPLMWWRRRRAARR